MVLLKAAAGSLILLSCSAPSKAWMYRDDIGAFWGIKGYEEQVTEVGTHHGHLSWPQYRFLGTYDSASVRRGFQVFAKNCGNCHGMIYKKYDVVLDKAYNQLELAVLFFHFLEYCQFVFHQPCPPPFQTILLLRVGGQRQSDPR